ncbi:MAG: S46 family peptidase [Chloroherpetonaceae bacterium]|nr:S46 family peptidase [Chloroherpetonaceae bacterium]
MQSHFASRKASLKGLLFSFALLLSSLLLAQAPFNPDTVKPGKFDNGKMWTFENPPLKYFESEYGIKATEAWLTKARKASLRFTEVGGTGSFVSPNGLIMTNHHVAREVAMKTAKKGEDMNANGFSAKSLAEERRVPGLFVDQLDRIEDVTALVEAGMAQGKTEAEKVKLRDSMLAVLKVQYGEKPEWKPLEIQTITLYSGGRYSLYGFKRYNDIRLVFIPELQLGYFGGDPDNFTYPRYAMDFSFFRAYDEKGNPCKTPDFYRFNINGVKEGEPIFVVGNPGRTERLNTVSQLALSRDFILPLQLRLLQSRSAILKAYNETAKSDSILNEIFGLENGIKAYSGQLRGLQDGYLFARKKAFEARFRVDLAANPKFASDSSFWSEMETLVLETKKSIPDRIVFNSQDVGLQRAYALLSAAQAKERGQTEQFEKIKAGVLEEMKNSSPVLSLDEQFLALHLHLALDYLGAEDEYTKASLQSSSPEAAAKMLIKETKLYDQAAVEALFNLSQKELTQSSEPFLKLGTIALRRLRLAGAKQRELQAKVAVLRTRLSKTFFEIYGTDTPPDATFSLRINDGVVKGYDYNGTTAPFQTTYYGLYDRYYSFNKQFPWSLPKRWENPPKELLSAPMNFVSTNDIIGGNSGSAAVNKNLEAVGLIFDGNIESLPGSFIYTPEANRAVSVHTGGIVAALKYIYKAEKLVKELTSETPKNEIKAGK